ncbi:MAG: sulfur carrier protein ThiS [Actinomycetota bacterium]
MKIVVNGDPVDLPEGATVRNVVELFRDARDGRGLAVALNAEVVHRGAWDATPLADDDRVEVLSAIGGG